LGRMISIAPSILSADFAHLAREIKKAEEGGADVIHVDVMDGHFVPNITLGPPVIASIRKVTELPLDAHLMIEEPARYVGDLVRAGVNWISVHVEADAHLNRTIRHIQDQGIRAGVALNPATPIGTLEEILPDVDFVLVMSVNPGFGGQHFIPSSLDKIRKLKELITSYSYRAQIEVDGGIGTGNLRKLIDAGADIVVAGSAIFQSATGATEAVREMRSIADSYSRVLETT
jgi:ribulose-phosphate 3-epimerase